MLHSLEMTERAARVRHSLDQHCLELGALQEKLKRPDLPLGKRAKLISRLPVVREKISQLFGSLQVG